MPTNKIVAKITLTGTQKEKKKKKTPNSFN